jgi:SPOR domain
MIKKIIWILFFPIIGYTQTKSVEIVKDHRLDLLIQKQEELNKKAYLENKKSIPGFRIMVISTNNRTKALDVKTTLLRDFPEHKTYLIYQSPNFKVQIGNFKTQADAEKLRKTIVRLYPDGVIIVPTTIEIKTEEEIIQN